MSAHKGRRTKSWTKGPCRLKATAVAESKIRRLVTRYKQEFPARGGSDKRAA